MNKRSRFDLALNHSTCRGCHDYLSSLNKGIKVVLGLQSLVYYCGSDLMTRVDKIFHDFLVRRVSTKSSKKVFDPVCDLMSDKKFVQNSYDWPKLRLHLVTEYTSNIFNSNNHFYNFLLIFYFF